METERKLVTLRRIDSVEKHPNADTLDIVTIGGWRVISKSGNFKPGDVGIYHEVDSFLPVTHPAYSDLSERSQSWKDETGAEHFGYRVKTMKLRGELSQGYLLRVALFPELASYDKQPEEEDLSSLLGVLKWERPISADMSGVVKGNFPCFLSKTDEERLQNLWGKFGNKDEKYTVSYHNEKTNEDIVVDREYEMIRDVPYDVTVKMDGSSMTAFLRGTDFGVCSRNLELKETEGNVYWLVANRLSLRKRMEILELNIAIQGELCGPGIQKNNDRLQSNELFVFRIINLDTGNPLCYADQQDILFRLNSIQGDPIHSVPYLGQRNFDFETIQEALDFAEGPSYNNSRQREGVVFTRVDDPSVHFKILSNKYLLKNDG